MFRIIIRTEDEELDTEVAKAVSEATSLFADLMAAPDDGEDMPETNADAKEHEDASSIVIKQLSVCILLYHNMLVLYGPVTVRSIRSSTMPMLGKSCSQL